MIIIGLTGGIACGKSTVSKEFIDHGFVVIDADSVARKVLDVGGEAYAKVIKEFSPLIDDLVMPESGELNRAALGACVFRDKTLLKKLNGITHPAIIKSIIKQMIINWWIGTKVLVLDVPLLFETGLNLACNLNLVVSLDEKSQLERLLKRNSDLTEGEAINRIKAQMSLQQKRSKATAIINNEGTIEELKLKVNDFLKYVNSIKWPFFTFINTQFFIRNATFEV